MYTIRDNAFRYIPTLHFIRRLGCKFVKSNSGFEIINELIDCTLRGICVTRFKNAPSIVYVYKRNIFRIEFFADPHPMGGMTSIAPSAEFSNLGDLGEMEMKDTDAANTLGRMVLLMIRIP